MKRFDKNCKLCERETTAEEGAMHGHLHGVFPITFCPECFSALGLIFKSVDEDEEESNQKVLTR